MNHCEKIFLRSRPAPYLATRAIVYALRDDLLYKQRVAHTIGFNAGCNFASLSALDTLAVSHRCLVAHKSRFRKKKIIKFKSPFSREKYTRNNPFSPISLSRFLVEIRQLNVRGHHLFACISRTLKFPDRFAGATSAFLGTCAMNLREELSKLFYEAFTVYYISWHTRSTKLSLFPREKKKKAAIESCTIDMTQAFYASSCINPTHSSII